jgi:hypothetical protein
MLIVIRGTMPKGNMFHRMDMGKVLFAFARGQMQAMKYW